MEKEELKRMELSIDKLDSYLLMEILSRVSMKNLIHCKFVCKTWLKLIGNPEFIKLHRSRCLTAGILIRSEYSSYGIRGMIRHQLAMVQEQESGDIGFQVVDRMPFSRSINFPNVDFGIVGCCHGLVCLSEMFLEEDDDEEEETEWGYVYVCNPILRQYITIPVRSMKIKYPSRFSFGFCGSTNQYKVVQTYDPIHEDHDNDVPVAKVYTLGTGQWRSIGNALSSVENASSSFDTFLHSSVHWIGSSRRRMKDSLFCFDFEKEEFRKLPSPPRLANDSSIKLGVLNGCLFAAFSTTDDPEKLQIWVMKEYGKDTWTKHFVIGNLHGGSIKDLAPLVFSNNRQKVLMTCDDSQVVCYDMESGNIEQTRIFQSRARFCYRYSCTPCFFSLEDLAGKEMFKKLLRARKKLLGLEKERELGTPEKPGPKNLSMEKEELERMELSKDKLDSNLLMDILSRLSMKNLSHCRLVCKTWLKLIGNSKFIKLHHSRSSTIGILMRIEYNSHRKHQLAMVQERTSDGIGFQVVEMMMSFSRRVNFPNVEFEIVGCCNGLICLSQEIQEEEDAVEEVEWDYVYVCNPILRQYITIPVYKCKKFKYTTGFCFGFCASSNQYKVVQTYDTIDEDADQVLVAEVYTLGTGQWRSIGNALASVENASSSFNTFLHSSVHWMGSSEGCMRDSLFCFDFEKEELRELPFSPSRLADDSSINLGVLNGCLLAAFSTTRDPEKLQIWVMNEYGKDSWTKHFVINLHDGIKDLAPLVFSNNGKVLMMCDHSKVVCYDMESGNIEETRMFQTRGRLYFPYSFTPCFFLLEDLSGKEKFKKLSRQLKRKTAG